MAGAPRGRGPPPPPPHELRPRLRPGRGGGGAPRPASPTPGMICVRAAAGAAGGGPHMAQLDLQPESAVAITGGASGIGLATAHAVAEVGRPVAIWDLHEDRAVEAAAAVAAAHGVDT